MAYNPFNIFRRNQRAIFAVITVFIMFTFVLSSGLGGKADFFDWFPSWLGARKKGDHLCTIDGTKVYSRDLERLRFQRVMANKFMGYAAAQTSDNLQRSMIEQMAQASPNLVQQIMQSQQFEQMGFAPPGSTQRLIQSTLDNPASKQADKDVVRAVQVQSDLMRAQAILGQTGSYLARTPNRTNRDLIEFMLWDRKAKDLGIDFTIDDVKKLIDREFMGLFKSDVEVRKAMEREVQGFSLDACLTALAAEFRVRAAQTALIGQTSFRGDHTLTAAPVFTPPYELFDFYRDKTSPTAYEVLAVPAALFQTQVTATPTEDELQRLFQERKDYEPDPAKPEPGFREPRKVKVEWVSVTGEEPYYQKQAAEWVRLTEQVAKSEVKGLVVPMAGMGPASWAAMTAAPTALTEPLVQSQYKTTVVGRHEGKLRFTWDGTSTHLMPFDVLDPHIVRAQNLAAAAGGGAGLAAAFGSPLLPSNLLVGATISAEQRARVKACMPLVLGAVPGPGMIATAVAGEAAFRKAMPEPLPIEAYKPELLKTLTEQKARELAVADLTKLKEEVDRLTDKGKRKDKSEAKAHIAEFVKARGLKTGATTDLQSEWTIGDDPGMAPLKAVLEKANSASNPHAALRGPVQFGQTFFWNTAGAGAPRSEAKGVYQPEFYPDKAPDPKAPVFGKADPVFLAWRTAEEPARSLSFSAARPRVIEAWKRVRARDLAKAEAERLANDLRAKPATSEFFIVQDLTDMRAGLKGRTTDPKVEEKVKLFRLDNVAPYQITTEPGGMTGGGGGPTVRPFQLAPSENIPYPAPEMGKALLEERTKPVKTVLVEPDQPRDTYYVVALVNRTERTVEDYRQHMAAAGFGRNQVRDQIAGAYRVEAGRRAYESILDLLKQEFNYVETDDQKKKLEDRDKKGEEV